MRLGEMLIGQGLCTQADVQAALTHQQRHGARLGVSLVAIGVLTIEQLLRTLRHQQQIASALGLCEQTLRGWERAYGTSHPNTNRARYNLARALLIAGRAVDSVPYAEAALAGHAAALGANHVWTAEAQRLVADVRLAAARASQTSA